MYYEGDVKDGEATGKDCLIIYRDGSFKKGEMRQGKMHGKGVFVWDDIILTCASFFNFAKIVSNSLEVMTNS